MASPMRYRKVSHGRTCGNAPRDFLFALQVVRAPGDSRIFLLDLGSSCVA